MTAYQVLGVPGSAEPGEIRRAYLARIKRAHPDTGGDERVAKILNAAWGMLKDADSRRRYDEALRRARTPVQRGTWIVVGRWSSDATTGTATTTAPMNY
jgi:curved DNA-binding protein CbpA